MVDRIKELEGEILVITEHLKEVSQRQNESQKNEVAE